jgi:hypothetical protein
MGPIRNRLSSGGTAMHCASNHSKPLRPRWRKAIVEFPVGGGQASGLHHARVMAYSKSQGRVVSVPSPRHHAAYHHHRPCTGFDRHQWHPARSIHLIPPYAAHERGAMRAAGVRTDTMVPSSRPVRRASTAASVLVSQGGMGTSRPRQGALCGMCVSTEARRVMLPTLRIQDDQGSVCLDLASGMMTHGAVLVPSVLGFQHGIDAEACRLGNVNPLFDEACAPWTCIACHTYAGLLYTPGEVMSRTRRTTRGCSCALAPWVVPGRLVWHAHHGG